MQLKDSKSYKLFVNDIKTQRTKVIYTNAILQYCEYKKLNKLDDLLKNNNNVFKIEDDIKEYLGYLRREGYSWSQANITKSALVLYYDCNRVDLNSKRIGRSLGERTINTRDIPYSREQIQRLLEFVDLKYKAAILLISSTSMRIGGLADEYDKNKFMRIQDLEPVEDLYKVYVYPSSQKYRYFTYCTPEARKAIDIYIKSRVDAGERVEKTSPLFRADFNPNKPNEIIKSVAYDTFKGQIRKKLIKAGLLEKKGRAPRGMTKEDAQLTAGLRKYGYNHLQRAGLDIEIREIIVGHRSLGVRQHYLRFTDEEILNQYRLAIPELTVTDAERTREVLKKTTTSIQDDLQKERAKREQAEQRLQDIENRVKEVDTNIGALSNEMEKFHRLIESIPKEKRDELMLKLAGDYLKKKEKEDKK